MSANTDRVVFLFAGLFILFTVPESGFSQTPHIVQTGCDTVSVNPLLRRFEFVVVNPGPQSVCYFPLYPQSDVCTTISCGAPDGWICYPDAGSGHAFWDAGTTENCVRPGSELGPFSIVLDADACCYQAVYYHYGPPEPISSEIICFECEAPTQTMTGTWGRIKSLYR